MISKVILKNFKGFQNIELECNKEKNILIGENGSGKTTILYAIGLVLSGSHAQIEKNGLASLFNSTAISRFLNSRDIKLLPELFVEIYFDDSYEEIKNNFDIEGTHNSKGMDSYGVSLRIIPNNDFNKEIMEALIDSDWRVFPFEFYKVEFLSFNGKIYTSYTKPFKFLYSLVNTSQINTTQENQKRIEEIYLDRIPIENRAKVNHEFRKSYDNLLTQLKSSNLVKDNDSEYDLYFEDSEKSFRNSVSAIKDGIDIKNLGQGEKVLLSVENSYCFLKDSVKILLIEEPENHLSYLNMLKLISILNSKTGIQVFIGTHSNMIASRLGIDNITLLKEGNVSKIQNLQRDTIRFFKKSTNQNLLNFALTDKVILVEGNAEYILMEKFFDMHHQVNPELLGVSIISVDGLSFKRYLEIAKEFESKKVAVITDNDKNYTTNILEKYSIFDEYNNIKVFSDQSDENYTFEVCVYNNNKSFIDGANLTRSDDVLEFMLGNKSEFALRLLEKLDSSNSLEDFKIPEYIKGAIEWVIRN